MKKLLFFLLVPVLGFGQNDLMTEKTFHDKYDSLLSAIMPLKEGKIYYDTILNAKGTQNELFSRTKRWELNTFKVADNPFATEDKDEGFISILTGIKNSYNDYYFMTKHDSMPLLLHISFNIRIYLKDGKARFIISDFTVEHPVVDEDELELNLINEIVHYGRYANKKYKKESFTSNQIISLSDFFQELNAKIKLITESFSKEIRANDENVF